jgi:hypothetical protein
MGKQLDRAGGPCYIERMFSNEAAGPAQEALAQVRSAVDLLQTLDLTGATDDDVLDLLRELETQKRRLPTVEHTATIDHLPAAIQAELDTTVEGILLDHAEQLDPKLLRVAARDLAAALDQDGILAQERDRQRHRALTVHQHADDTATLHGRLDAICTELLLTYLDSAARPRPAANGSKDPRSAAQRRHDAVKDAFHALLRSGVLPDCGGVVASIMLTMTEQQLSSHRGTVTTGHGTRITVPEALTLLGDAQLTPITLTKTMALTPFGGHGVMRLELLPRGGCSVASRRRRG